MVSKLDLYILNNDSSVAPFPSEAEQIVLYDFTFEAQRMGSAPEITATIQATGSLENSLTTKVFCEYKGERYFLKNTPSSSKDNTDPRYTFDLTFVSERTILDNVYMIDAVQGNSGLDGYQSNSTTIVFMGDIYEAVARLNAAMSYTGVGYSVVIDSGIYTEDKQVSFNDKYFTEVLQEYAQIFSVPYYFVGKVAHFGWAQYDVPTVKYLDGLISVSKDIQNTRIINRATATGSSDNLPHYYPNPTPRGFITYSVPNGITVNSEHKLALLPVGSSLIYIPETQEIAVKGTYGFNRITDRHPDLSDSDQYATLIIPQYDSSEGQIVSGPVALLKNTFPESKDFTIDLVVRHPKGALTLSLDNDFPVDPLGAVACTRVDDALIEDTSITVKIASSNTVTSPTHNNDEETTFRLNISDFPAGTERYIYMRFLNRGINRSDSKIFQFSFSVSERGLIQGWHIQDSNGITDEKVVNATDYGLRVSDNFAGGTVSYSVTRKIPYATTLMPPIYRESSGEHRFYNAINGAYKGITFENEYSAESPKEGITKFEDIKPTIKGITNALGYRIDMFSAFAYDLNDNDDTVLSDSNTEEYQHPYFYAKLRKIDGAYGFNLFDQALESTEMAVSMTSGICGACKFTIMVDKNTQRNLVMVDDDGNLMYDASGNVMMATDARGLDKQNDTVNNEVWVALKKDNSTFGQIMPNVEYNHYPETSDTFVLLHILMPEVYIKDAEERLKTAIIDFLVANNSVQFNSSINFSRIYLHNNPDVVAILTENSRISIDYNDKLYSYFISSVTYRKAKEDILPEISVELTQDIQPTTSNIQAAISAINVTQQQVAVIAGKSEKQPKYLKSDTADTAQGKITFEKGLDFTGNLNTKNFKRGALDGRGFGVYLDSQGRIVVEADKIVSRQGGYGGGGSGTGNYVTTDTIQDILAVKDFDKGLKIGGLHAYKSQADTIYLDCNLVVRGGVTAFGTNETITASIFEALPIDGVTLKRTENGVLYVASGGSGGSGGGGISIEDLESYLTTNGYATQSWVTDKGYITNVVNDNVTINGNRLQPLYIKSQESNTGILFFTKTQSATLMYSGDSNWRVTNNGWGASYYLLHSGNYSDYALPKDGTAVAATTLKTSTGFLFTRTYDSSRIVNIGADATAEGYSTYIDGMSIRFRYGSAYTTAMEITSNGNVAIGGTTASEKLEVYGNVKATSFIGNASSATKLKNYYSSRPASADVAISGDGSLLHFKATGSMTTSKPSGDGHILHFNWDGANGYDAQLFLPTGGNAVESTQYRTQKAKTWGSWKTLLDSSNYSKYALPLTGGTVKGQITSEAVENFVAKGTGYSLYFGIGAGQVNRGIYDLTNNHWWIYRSNSTDTYVPNGNVAIGGTTASAKLHVYGSVISTGAFNSYSENTHYLVKGKEVIGSYKANYFICDSAAADGYRTHLVGKSIAFQTSTSKVTNATLDESGNFSITGVLKLPLTATNAFSGAQLLFADGVGRIGVNTNNMMAFYADSFRLRPASTASAASSIGVLIDKDSNLSTTGDLQASGVLRLPVIDSGFANPRIVFGDSIIRIGATTAGLLGVYASGDIRLNPNSASSANSTMGLWLKASGFNGINISNPTQALHVNGKGIFADATNPWVSLQRDGVNWYLQVVSTGLKIGKTSALGILVDDSGNLVAPGGVTATNSSDERLKRNLRKFNASKVLMSLGGVYEYEYIDSEVRKNHIYEGTHYGLIYQNVKGTTLDVMCHEREDGMGALNYIHQKFISLIAGATMENISEVETLKREVRTLKAKVKQLEQRA